jgi:hypothetical protein
MYKTYFPNIHLEIITSHRIVWCSDKAADLYSGHVDSNLGWHTGLSWYSSFPLRKYGDNT